MSSQHVLFSEVPASRRVSIVFCERFGEKSVEAIIDEIENGLCTRSTLS